MKKVICFLLMFTFLYANAQDGYSITYNKTLIGFESRIFEMRYVYNDTFSFCYFKHSSNNKLKKAKIFSKKLIHHAQFTDKKNMITYDIVNNDGKKGYFVDTISLSEWKAVMGTKIILGIECKGALKVSSENDSTLVWYNASLGDGLGVFHSNVNFGTPLEIFDQKNNSHFVAIKIEKGDFKFNLPKGEILLRSSFKNDLKSKGELRIITTQKVYKTFRRF